MKLNVDIDLDWLFDGDYGDDEMLRKSIMANITGAVADKLYDENIIDDIKDSVHDIVVKNEKKIIEEVIDRSVAIITERVERKQAIKEKMPKASEINSISKEWTDYFSSLIDKAIAKKFH